MSTIHSDLQEFLAAAAVVGPGTQAINRAAVTPAGNAARSSPLGAMVETTGVNFSLYSRDASGIDLFFDDNRGWNCGVEGPTDDPAIERLRNRQAKTFFDRHDALLGLPMLVMGDEVRRTQGGKNNAYCQDN